MINIFKYRRLIAKATQTVTPLVGYRIQSYIPTPTDNDYKRGYIKRYFIQKANDASSYVFEVDEQQYSNISNDPHFLLVNLTWRIIGTVEQVRESNSKSVTFASKTVKSITLYLPNTLQFYKR